MSEAAELDPEWDIPHCSRCGVVLYCDGADKEHVGRDRARISALEAQVAKLTEERNDLRTQVDTYEGELDWKRLYREAYARAEKAEKERDQAIAASPLNNIFTRAEKAEARVRELESEGISENHAIFVLTDQPRAGYTLQDEIRAQLEEEQARVRELEEALHALIGLCQVWGISHHKQATDAEALLASAEPEK